MKHLPNIAGGLLGLAFHIFLTNGGGLLDPPVVALSLLAAYLLWVGRKKFCGLLNN
ncbi:MAG: hypothetical protein KJO21_03055 [Verrucomicrobiae bacterium]|nr:hypothetical protein [Verrucomicrobiae bacterium]NNJ41895.1 hypothetical protein [Akkermansiaceae bacterium]